MELNNTHKAIILYLISAVCLLFYFYLESEEYRGNLIVQASATTVRDVGDLISYGLFKIVFLVSGLAIPVIVTYMLIREK